MNEEPKSQKCGFTFREFSWILLLLLSLIGNYYLLTKDSPKTFNEEEYNKKIANYKKQINLIDKQNDSLNLDNEKRTEKILGLKEELKELNKKSKHYEELYKKTIRSIDSMSDNDITRLFTKEFN